MKNMAHKKNVRKKNVLSANESLAGARSWIKTGIVWSIAQTNVAGLKYEGLDHQK